MQASIVKASEERHGINKFELRPCTFPWRVERCAVVLHELSFKPLVLVTRLNPSVQRFRLIVMRISTLVTWDFVVKSHPFPTQDAHCEFRISGDHVMVHTTINTSSIGSP